MLTKRIIPCLDIKDGRIVKGVKFLGLKDAGDPVEVAKVYDQQLADELVFLDITASFEKRKTLTALVQDIAENIYMPFTVGGGIRNLFDIRELLNAGADKVSINTAAVKQPVLISDAAGRFGSQCIVVAIDAKSCPPVSQFTSLSVNSSNGQMPPLAAPRHPAVAGEPANAAFGGSPPFGGGRQTKKWQVYINGGKSPTDLDAVEWAKQCAGLGAGEILLTSMDYDGTKDGYDLELTERISQAVNIPVIASGGAGKLEHFYDVITKAGAAACLAATIFHYQEYSVKQVKEYLAQKGIPVRL